LFNVTARVVLLLTEVAVERDVEGGLLLADMGCGMPFRAGTFDGVIRLYFTQLLRYCSALSGLITAI